MHSRLCPFSQLLIRRFVVKLTRTEKGRHNLERKGKLNIIRKPERENLKLINFDPFFPVGLKPLLWIRFCFGFQRFFEWKKYLNFRWIWVVKRSSFFITLSVDVFTTVYSRNFITRISSILSHSRNCLYHVIPLNVPRQTSVIFYNPIGQFINYACALVNEMSTDGCRCEDHINYFSTMRNARQRRTTRFCMEIYAEHLLRTFFDFLTTAENVEQKLFLLRVQKQSPPYESSLKWIFY